MTHPSMIRTPSRTERVLFKLPDCDDTLRRLADVLRVPPECRRRACRREGSCQGGYGPSCFFEKREFFADAPRDNMHDYRQLWTEQRAMLRASLRR